jgi:dihydroorotase
VSFDTVIRGGTLFYKGELRRGDLGIIGGKIAAIGEVDNVASEVIDASGLIVSPGLIDTQVHFREPGLEHKEDLESGTRAALAGGVTTVFEMPNTNPTTTTKQALEDKLRRAQGRVWSNVSFFVGASTANADELADLEQLPGTPGVKIFMGSSTGTLLVSEDNDLRQVLQHGKRRCPIHAEDEPRNRARKELVSDHPHTREHPFLRDAESARLATERILRLSAETRRLVHVLHVSTADELPLLWSAKGFGATCEVTPQHLWFAAPDCYDRLGSLAQMNPPIRSEAHRAAIRSAYVGGLFAVIGSDHAPHTLEEKALPYPQSPSGMPGVQTLLPVMLTLASQGTGTIEQVLNMTTKAPSDLYGVRNKGIIELGYDADLTLIDPKATWTFDRSMVQSKCGWSPYEGVELTGKVIHTLVNGQWNLRDGEVQGTPSGTSVEFTWK